MSGTPISYNEANYWISSHKLNYNLSESQVQISRRLSPNEVKSSINNRNPFGALYRGRDSNGNWSGHWLVGVGYANAQGHEMLVVSNDPNGGVQRTQTYTEFELYAGDYAPFRYWVQSAY